MTTTDQAGPDASVPLGTPFLRVWFGQVVSIVGSTLSGVGAALVVYLDTGSEAWLGVLTALGSLPAVLIGPFLGLIDRYPRKNVMVVGDSLAAVGTVAALILAFTGRLSPWHLAVTGFIGGTGSAVQSPATMAAVPDLTDRRALDRANGLLQLGPGAGIVLGPILATPLVATLGIEAVLIADLLTFMVAITLTSTTRFGAADMDDEGASNTSMSPPDDDRTWAPALAWLRGPGRGLAVLLFVFAAVNFGLSFFNIARLAVATRTGGPARAGLALGTGGVTTIVTGVWIGRKGLPERRIPVLGWGLLLGAVGAVLTGLRPNFALVVVGVMVSLAGYPAVAAAASTLFHEHVPATMQGRVFGLRSAVSQALLPLGSAVSGFVIARLLAPAMAEGGPLAASVGSVTGVGPERGAAVALLAVGVWLAALAVWLFSDRRIQLLDRPTEPEA